MEVDRYGDNYSHCSVTINLKKGIESRTQISSKHSVQSVRHGLRKKIRSGGVCFFISQFKEGAFWPSFGCLVFVCYEDCKRTLGDFLKKRSCLTRLVDKVKGEKKSKFNFFYPVKAKGECRQG